ncbi:unnamed protein product [Acanthoscelides obtectus]|uniref:Uncharacterized protein n=1 Tax=Acanthoscelides obtectus TaxID=200917 RepID=A0A9P0NY13_ACAOB|nr:unnamed protein product [Acanthoscelides obtectus]CAK1646155.1 hypothetical protein AOBTE_LOCUS14482 [Acanthoscelides obtectus]
MAQNESNTLLLKKLPKHEKSVIKEMEKEKCDLCCLCFTLKWCQHTFEDPDYVFEHYYICKDCWEDNKEYCKSECWFCKKVFKVELRKLKTIKFSGRKSFFLCRRCLDLIEYVPCVQDILFF